MREEKNTKRIIPGEDKTIICKIVNNFQGRKHSLYYNYHHHQVYRLVFLKLRIREKNVKKTEINK